MRKIYLIDGVSVPLKTWKSRQKWGEYIGAKFTVADGPVAPQREDKRKW